MVCQAYFVCSEHPILCRARLKRDGTREETRVGLSAKWTIPFELTKFSIYSINGSRGVRISGSNAGYTMFWGSVQDYWEHTPRACYPFISPIGKSPCAFRFQLNSTYSQPKEFSSHILQLFLPDEFQSFLYGYVFKVVSSLQDYNPHFKMYMEITR